MTLPCGWSPHIATFLVVLLLFLIFVVLIFFVVKALQQQDEWSHTFGGWQETTVWGHTDNCGCARSKCSCERTTFCCKNGKDGKDGKNGRKGKDGCPGHDGRCLLDFASFFAYQGCSDNAPRDNPDPILPGNGVTVGQAIAWPRVGPTTGSGNITLNPNPVFGTSQSILIRDIGVYAIEVATSIDQAAQIVLAAQNNQVGATIIEQLETVTGRNGLNTQIVMLTTITINQPNINISIRNLGNSTTPFTISGCAGSVDGIPSTSWLRVTQLADRCD